MCTDPLGGVESDEESRRPETNSEPGGGYLRHLTVIVVGLQHTDRNETHACEAVASQWQAGHHSAQHVRKPNQETRASEIDCLPEQRLPVCGCRSRTTTDTTHVL